MEKNNPQQQRKMSAVDQGMQSASLPPEHRDCGEKLRALYLQQDMAPINLKSFHLLMWSASTSVIGDRQPPEAREAEFAEMLQKHFKDGEPTKENPDPYIADGTEVGARRKQSKKRQCKLPTEAKGRKFKRIGSSKESARRGGRKKILTDMTTGLKVSKFFEVKKEILDGEDQTHCGELVAPRGPLNDITSVLLTSSGCAQESDYTYSQQHESKYPSGAEEEFKIEVNPDWQPDNGSNLQDVTKFEKGDTDCISKDDKMNLLVITSEDKERETTCYKLSVSDSVEEKLNKLSVDRCVDQKIAIAVRGKSCHAGWAETGNQKNVVFSGGGNAFAVQNSTKDEPQKFSDGSKEMVCTKQSSSETSIHQAVPNNSCGSASAVETAAISKKVFTDLPSEHKGNKVFWPRIPGTGVACITPTSSLPLGTPAGQNTLIVARNLGKQSGALPGCTSGQKIISQTTVGGKTSGAAQSADCSSQKLLSVPTTATENGVCSGQNTLLLNPGFSEEVATRQITGDSSGCTAAHSSIFICGTCGSWIIGLQALSLHKFTCFMIKNLVLTSSYVVNPGAPVLMSFRDPSRMRPLTAELAAKEGSPTAPLTQPLKNLSKAPKVNLKNVESILPMLENKEHPDGGKAEPDLCPKCGKTFNSPKYFDIHIRLHEDEKPFTCNQCPKAFKYLTTLNAHQHRHNRERTFQCDRCGQQFFYRNNLKRHMLIHTKDGPLKCPECPATFFNPSSFKIHVRVHTGERPFSCKFCGKAFRDTSSLNVHLKIHTCNKPYKCEVCAAAFQRPSGLKRHIQVLHAAASPFVCSHCGVSFDSKGILKKHMQFHSRDMERMDTAGSDTSELSQSAFPHHP